MAAQMIEAGDADIVVAGGMENMDMAPFAMMKGRYGYRMGYPMGKSELVDTMVNDALWDATGCNMHMGMTAENVCTNETYQKKYGYSPITREMLDEFSYHSQEKAAKAIADGAFKDEIVPVVIKGKKGDTVFDTMKAPPELHGSSGQAEALLQEGWYRYRCKLLRHQRWRSCSGCHERRKGQGAGC